jgi:hypothetical protein
MPKIGYTKFPYHCASNEGKWNEFDDNVQVCIAVSIVYKLIITNNQVNIQITGNNIAIRNCWQCKMFIGCQSVVHPLRWQSIVKPVWYGKGVINVCCFI